MKIKNIRLTVKTNKNALHDFDSMLSKARKGENIASQDELSFENINTLRKVLTEKRIELLRVIRQQEPDSLYSLAKMVKRDLKSVNTDVNILVELGLMSLESIKQERHKIKPGVAFDRLSVEIAI